MSTRFENHTRRLVILELNSGATVHLAPGEISRAIEAYETENNPGLEWLLRASAIRLAPGGEDGGGGGGEAALACGRPRADRRGGEVEGRVKVNG